MNDDSVLFRLLLVYSPLLVVYHGDACCRSWHIRRLPVPNYLLVVVRIVFIVLLSWYVGSIPSENIWSFGAQSFEIFPDIHLIIVLVEIGINRPRSFLLSKTGFEVFRHLRGEDIVSADVALLEDFFLFWCRYDFLLHDFSCVGILHKKILLTIDVDWRSFVFVFHAVEQDGFYDFIVVPVDVGLFFILVCVLVWLAFELFLFGGMVFKHLLAFGEDGISVVFYLL